jgi:hypothetical protein
MSDWADTPKWHHQIPEINQLAGRKKQYIEFYSLTHSHGLAFPAFLTRLSTGWSTEVQEITMGSVAQRPMITRAGGLLRTIDLGFQVVAESRRTAEENLQKLSLLAKLLYPSSTKEVTTRPDPRNVGQTIKETNYVNPQDSIWTIKFMNLITDQEGPNKKDKGVKTYIKNFNMDFDLDAGFVEHRDHHIHPKAVNVSLELLILPTGEAGWFRDTSTGGTVPKPGWENFPFGEPFPDTVRGRKYISYVRKRVVPSGDEEQRGDRTGRSSESNTGVSTTEYNNGIIFEGQTPLENVDNQHGQAVQNKLTGKD